MRCDVFGQGFRYLYVKDDLRARLFGKYEAREKRDVAIRPDGRALLVSEAQAIAIAVERHTDGAGVLHRLRPGVFHHGGAVRIRGVMRVRRIDVGIVLDDFAAGFAEEFRSEHSGGAVSRIDEYLQRAIELRARDKVGEVGFADLFLPYGSRTARVVFFFDDVVESLDLVGEKRFREVSPELHAVPSGRIVARGYHHEPFYIEMVLGPIAHRRRDASDVSDVHARLGQGAQRRLMEAFGGRARVVTDDGFGDVSVAEHLREAARDMIDGLVRKLLRGLASSDVVFAEHRPFEGCHVRVAYHTRRWWGRKRNFREDGKVGMIRLSSRFHTLTEPTYSLCAHSYSLPAKASGFAR